MLCLKFVDENYLTILKSKVSSSIQIHLHGNFKSLYFMDGNLDRIFVMLFLKITCIPYPSYGDYPNDIEKSEW